MSTRRDREVCFSAIWQYCIDLEDNPRLAGSARVAKVLTHKATLRLDKI